MVSLELTTTPWTLMVSTLSAPLINGSGWSKATEERLLKSSQVKSSQYHFIANTNSVHKRQINKKVKEFVKGKPKGTNPAIMSNPIDIVWSKWQQKIINLIDRETTSKLREPCKMQKTKQKQTTCTNYKLQKTSNSSNF